MSEKVIKLKQALEKENLEFFLEMYNSNFPIIENFFDKNFSLKNNIIKDTYLSFIHREREQNFPIFRTLRKDLISSNLFYFLQSILASLIKNFTYLETIEVKDKNQTNYLFINRGEHYFYDDIISQVKNSNGNVSYANDIDLSMINKQVKFKNSLTGGISRLWNSLSPPKTAPPPSYRPSGGGGQEELKEERTSTDSEVSDMDNTAISNQPSKEIDEEIKTLQDEADKV